MADTKKKHLNKQPANRSLGLVARRFLTESDGRIKGRHWLTFCGITLGVAALLTVSNVMNGFDKDMRQRIIGTRAEIRINKPDYKPFEDYQQLISQLEKLPYIQAAAPLVRNELILVFEGRIAATACYGIDLSRQMSVSPVLQPIDPKELNSGKSSWLQGVVSGKINPSRFEQNGIIIGADMAQNLGAGVGDTLKLVSPLGTVPTPLGMFPQTLDAIVTGIFIAGMPEYDRLYSYVPMSAGQYFSGYGDMIDQIVVKTTNQKRLFRITRNLQKAFPEYKIENWSSFDSSLYRAMRFEKYLMLVVLGLVFVLAAFNMSSNIYRTIVQKRRAIGILKTLGYTNKALLHLFMRHGFIIGSSGIAAGIILSLFISLIQLKFGIVQLPVGNLPNLILPVDIRLADYLAILLIAVFITWISIYLPTRTTYKITPIALIRELS
ncbi:MAG: ABC transporter permease [Candidatus Cloacimonetes bacterium]|nr:ABC transporter permease [Candidatus Cloacimonadota bacterium]